MLFAYLILAHILAELTFQTPVILQNKMDSRKHFFLHLLIVFSIFLLVSIPYISPGLVFIILIITVFHGLIDNLKGYISQKIEKQSLATTYDLEIFLTDQLLHIISILILAPFIREVDLNQVFVSVLENILSDFLYPVLITEEMSAFFVLFLAIIILNFKGATVIVRAVLKKYKTELSSRGDKGKAIGNLERLLVILFVISGSYSLIGFMFTAKSLIRFKEIGAGDKENFVEYYLIGSFISILIGFLSGELINYLKFLL